MPTSTSATVIRAGCAGFQARELDRQGQVLARARPLRRLQGDPEAAPLPVHREPRQTQRPARQALGRLVEGPVGGGHQVGARAPLGLHRDADRGAALRHADLQGLVHAVADDHQAGLTLERRAELGPQGVAGRVGGLVEGQVEEVGRLRGLGAAPAHLEAEARGRLRGARGRDLQPIAAEAHRRLDPARAGGLEVDGAAGDAPGGLDRLERPAPVRPVPLVGGVDPRQGPGHARPGEERPVGVRQHHVEARDPALLQIGEALAQGEDRARREDRQGQAARQRPAAGLADRQGDLRLQRPRGRNRGHRHRDGGAALPVRGGMVLQFLGGRLDRLVVETDGIGLKPLDAARRGRLHGHAARHVEIGARGAVEVAGGDVDLRGLAPVQGRLPGLEGHLQPLGDVILHEEAGLADRGRLRVRVGGDPPRAVHRPRQERQRQRPAAEPLVGHRDAPVLDAVRPLDHQGQRQVRHGGAAGIAQQGRELDGLARAVDPALREQVGVEAAGLRPSLHAAVGEVEGAEVQVEEAVIAAGLRHHEARRQTALPAGEPRIEGDVPLRVRGPCGPAPRCCGRSAGSRRPPSPARRRANAGPR